MGRAETATSSFANLAGRAGGGLGQIAFSLNQIYGASQLVGGAFRTVFNTANEWKNMGAQAQRSAIALDAYAGSAEEAAKWTDAVADAARGSMTEGQAAAEAYRLMKFGLADTAEAAGQFVRDIAIVTAVNPMLKDTASAIEQIQLTIANQSYMRLDQLGISASAVKDRIADLRSEISGLSQPEAFEMAVMAEISAQADTVGDSVLELDERQQRLNARFDQFKEDVGKGALLVFESLAIAMDNIAESDWGQNIQAQLDKVFTTFDNAPDEFWSKLFLVAGGGEITEEMIWWASYAGLTGPVDRSDLDMSGAQVEAQRAREDEQATAEMLARLSQNYAAMNIFSGIDYGLNSNDLFWRDKRAGTAGDVMNAMMGFDDLYRSHPIFTTGYTRSRQRRFEYDDLMQALYGGGYGLPAGFQPDPTLPDFLQRRQNVLLPGASGLRDKRLMEGYGANVSLRAEWLAMAQGMLGSNPWFGGGMTDPVRGGFYNAGGLTPQAELWRRGRGAEIGENVLGAFQQIPGVLGQAADAMARLDENARSAAEQFGSLDEKFGVVRTGFESDVLGEMGDALRDLEVDAEKAEEAILAYEWATGQATASSLIFDDRLQYLTRHFGEGFLTADEYAEALRRLSELDLTFFNEMTEGWDLSKVQGFMDQLMRLTTTEFRDWADYGSSLTTEGVMGGMLGQAQRRGYALDQEAPEGGGGPFGPLADSAKMSVDQAMTELQRFQDEGVSHVVEWARQSNEEVITFQTEFTSEMDLMKQAIDAIFTPTYTIKVDYPDFPGGGGPVYGEPREPSTRGSDPNRPGGVGHLGFAGGTPWTGSGGVWEPAGTVHNREAVVPSQGMYVKPSPGGLELSGGAGARNVRPVVVKLQVDGRTLREVLIDADRLVPGPTDKAQ